MIANPPTGAIMIARGLLNLELVPIPFEEPDPPGKPANDTTVAVPMKTLLIK
jgi:hypothetical protein